MGKERNIARLISLGALVASSCTPREVKPVVGQESLEPRATATEVQPTPTFPSYLVHTREPQVTPTEAPSYKLEDGTQMERVEQGEFNDLFPGSEVFMSERGDVVIINEETHLQLAGQKMETPYGSYTVLIGDTQYQYFYKHYFNETTKLGGYMNMAESPLKDELGRIFSTLIQLKEREIKIGSVNLATHQPQPKNLVAIYMNPGTTSRLADSLPEGLMDPSKLETNFIGQLGFPLIETPNGQFLLARFSYGYTWEQCYEIAQTCLESDMSYQRRFFWELLTEAAVAQGVGDRKSTAGWEDILNSPFQPLFSDPRIIEAMEALTKYYSSTEPPYDIELINKALAKERFGAPGLITVDFEKFR